MTSAKSSIVEPNSKNNHSQGITYFAPNTPKYNNAMKAVYEGIYLDKEIENQKTTWQKLYKIRNAESEWLQECVSGIADNESFDVIEVLGVWWSWRKSDKVCYKYPPNYYKKEVLEIKIRRFFDIAKELVNFVSEEKNSTSSEENIGNKPKKTSPPEIRRISENYKQLRDSSGDTQKCALKDTNTELANILEQVAIQYAMRLFLLTQPKRSKGQSNDDKESQGSSKTQKRYYEFFKPSNLKVPGSSGLASYKDFKIWLEDQDFFKKRYTKDAIETLPFETYFNGYVAHVQAFDRKATISDNNATQEEKKADLLSFLPKDLTKTMMGFLPKSDKSALSKVNHHYFENFDNLRNLFEVENCKPRTQKELDVILANRFNMYGKLKSLDLSNVDIEDCNVIYDQITPFKKLQELKIKSTWLLPIDTLLQSPLKDKITVLDIFHSTLSGRNQEFKEGLKKVKQFKKLRQLMLKVNTLQQLKDIVETKDLECLDSLDDADMPLKDKIMALNFSSATLTDQGFTEALNQIKQIRTLKKLRLKVSSQVQLAKLISVLEPLKNGKQSNIQSNNNNSDFWTNLQLEIDGTTLPDEVSIDPIKTFLHDGSGNSLTLREFVVNPKQENFRLPKGLHVSEKCEVYSPETLKNFVVPEGMSVNGRLYLEKNEMLQTVTLEKGVRVGGDNGWLHLEWNDSLHAVTLSDGVKINRGFCLWGTPKLKTFNVGKGVEIRNLDLRGLAPKIIRTICYDVHGVRSLLFDSKTYVIGSGIAVALLLNEQLELEKVCRYTYRGNFLGMRNEKAWSKLREELYEYIRQKKHKNTASFPYLDGETMDLAQRIQDDLQDYLDSHHPDIAGNVQTQETTEAPAKNYYMIQHILEGLQKVPVEEWMFTNSDLVLSGKKELSLRDGLIVSKSLFLKNNPELEKAAFLKKVRVCRSLEVCRNDALQELIFGKHMDVISGLRIHRNAVLQSITFQGSVGEQEDGRTDQDILILNNPLLQTVTFPKFMEVYGCLNISENDAMQRIVFAKEMYIKKDLLIRSNRSLQMVSFGAGTHVKEIVFLNRNKILETVDFQEGAQMEKDLVLSGNPALKTLSFSDDVKIDGELRISNTPKLTSIEMGVGVQIKKLRLYGCKGDVLKTLLHDVRGMEELKLDNNTKVAGSGLFVALLLNPGLKRQGVKLCQDYWIGEENNHLNQKWFDLRDRLLENINKGKEEEISTDGVLDQLSADNVRLLQQVQEDLQDYVDSHHLDKRYRYFQNKRTMQAPEKDYDMIQHILEGLQKIPVEKRVATNCGSELDEENVGSPERKLSVDKKSASKNSLDLGMAPFPKSVLVYEDFRVCRNATLQTQTFQREIYVRGDILIYDNHSLQSLAFTKQTVVHGYIDISENSALQVVRFVCKMYIKRDLLIQNNHSLQVVEFQKSVQMFGDLVLYGNRSLQTVSFAASMHVKGTIDLSRNKALEVVNFGESMRVGGNIDLYNSPSLEVVNFGTGIHVRETIFISRNKALEEVSFGASMRVGGNLNLRNNPSLEEVNFGKGMWVEGDLKLDENRALEVMRFGADTRVGGNLNLRNNPSLEEVNFGKGMWVKGDLKLDENRALKVVNFGAYTRVGGNLDLYRNLYTAIQDPLLSMVNFGAYTRVDGNLNLRDNSSLKVVNFADGVRILGELNLSYIPNIACITVGRGVEIKKAALLECNAVAIKALLHDVRGMEELKLDNNTKVAGSGLFVALLLNPGLKRNGIKLGGSSRAFLDQKWFDLRDKLLKNNEKGISEVSALNKLTTQELGLLQQVQGDLQEYLDNHHPEIESDTFFHHNKNGITKEAPLKDYSMVKQLLAELNKPPGTMLQDPKFCTHTSCLIQ